jgi:cyclase
MNSLSRRTHAVAGLVLAVVLSMMGRADRAQAQERQAGEPGQIAALQVRPNVYMLSGAGANIVVHLGWMGALVVDTGAAEMSAKVLAAIARITDSRIRFIMNTSADADHVGGNEALSKAGRTLIFYTPGAGGFGGSDTQTNFGAAAIMAHENVLKRMSAPTGQQSPFPVAAWPTETFTGVQTRSLYLNNDGIQMIYQPAAHSDADSIVLFRRADVIAAGDILDLRHFPVIDIEHGGTIEGEIAALNRLIDLTIPAAPLVWHEDRTLVIPAHGRVCDQTDVVDYRDMVTIVRDVIKDMVKKGMTLDQIKAANPANGYRRQYGSDTGPWTTDMFVTAVYKSLTARR